MWKFSFGSIAIGLISGDLQVDSVTFSNELDELFMDENLQEIPGWSPMKDTSLLK